MIIRDIFAGPGGWEQGIKSLDLEAVGYEWEANACTTARAAGFERHEVDVSAVDLAFVPPTTGLIASPPCQDFSMAGKRIGLSGIRGKMVFEVLRWAEALKPEWIACEQVMGVLPVWKLFERELGKMGYRTWSGIVNCADYGVPQTRKRAILMASRSPFQPPQATHTEQPDHSDLFGEELEPWITMAEALGWTGVVGFPRLADTPSNLAGDDIVELDGVKYRGRDFRSVDKPSFVVTSKARSWKHYPEGLLLHTNRDQRERANGQVERQVIDPATQPAPTFTAKSGGQWRLRPGTWAQRKEGEDEDWEFRRGHRRVYELDEPAPTLHFGHDSIGWVWEHDELPEGIQITPAEAGVLQSFPIEFPWQGAKTRQFEQVGNACPPTMARAIIKELIS